MKNDSAGNMILEGSFNNVSHKNDAYTVNLNALNNKHIHEYTLLAVYLHKS